MIILTVYRTYRVSSSRTPNSPDRPIYLQHHAIKLYTRSIALHGQEIHRAALYELNIPKGLWASTFATDDSLAGRFYIKMLIKQATVQLNNIINMNKPLWNLVSDDEASFTVSSQWFEEDQLILQNMYGGKKRADREAMLELLTPAKRKLLFLE
jgi:hypothetical protein